ncbi:LysR family transcriptional regulator [Undibacterium fentianense]|uniref:LysR family transcriptional regulator n=1 Tax=Undibacterium fentianense TaxID=2828728 RepID=A0A941IE73_9BURK|nr:LysR family transcriptional regulator [Undibacterium fentianense]MBR7800778.1 LysR family transcriptional regulator [Undibacterium fentianense]
MASLDQIDMNALRIFDTVVAAGSFTAAANRLDVAKAKISVQIARLEQQLGTALFVRTTRRMNLTESGKALYAHCQIYLPALDETLSQLANRTQHETLQGVLRVSASVNHASQSVAPALAKFSIQHPQLKIDLRTNDRISDLVADGIDIAFRMGWLRDSSQRAMKLGEFQQWLMAAPSYLERCGTPKSPQELREHEWIALSLLPSALTWKFIDQQGQSQLVHMKSRLQVDAPSTLLALLVQGAGVSVMDEMSAQAVITSGKLQRLLPEWRLNPGGIYAVLPPGRHVPTNVRAFIDFYRQFLGI